MAPLGAQGRAGINVNNERGCTGGNFIAAFCDGHIQRIPAKTDEKVLRCMIQWNNKEAFKLP